MNQPPDPAQPADPSPSASGDPTRRRRRYRGTHPQRYDQKYKERDPARYPDMQDHVRAQGRTPAGSHVPVLLQPLLDALSLRPGQIVADGTLGFGGHAAAVLERILPGGRLIGLDLDAVELERTRARLAARFPAESVTLVHTNFAGLAALAAEHAPAGLDAIYADLGVSSMQIDDPSRGFSYKHDGPLDMRMDARNRRTAADVVARAGEAELSQILSDFGDEPRHAEVARRMVAARAASPIRTTGELARIVRAAVGAAESTAALARVFQALRIAVNREREALRELLRIAPGCLAPGGCAAIISFHSGEDGLVKAAFSEGLARGDYAEISREPVMCTPAERRDNPRAASARLRWARRTRPNAE